MTPRDKDIANELQDLVPGAAWAELTPFPGEVPHDYFAQLPAQIMQKIAVQDELDAISPLFSDLTKTITLSAPAAGYFDQLPDQIMQKIAVQEELESLSPLLADMPKITPFSVPEGYFEQLMPVVPAPVVNAPLIISSKSPAKVVPMRRYRKWAVAACLIAIISTGTIFFTKNNHASDSVTTVTADNALADVSDQAIVEYLQTHMDSFDKDELLSLASLTTTTGTAELPETSELSAEAIQRYLDNTGFLKESPTNY